MNLNPIKVLTPKRQSSKAYIVRNLLEFTESIEFPNYFICDIKMKTLSRIYNTFKVINLYDNEFKTSTIVPNFYDDNFNF